MGLAKWQDTRLIVKNLVYHYILGKQMLKNLQRHKKYEILSDKFK